jgi:hypothetical protein
MRIPPATRNDDRAHGRPDVEAEKQVQRPLDRVDRFIDAVQNNESMAALKMLEEAGGMCNAIALAKEAQRRTGAEARQRGGGSQVHFSMSSHGEEHTIEVGESTSWNSYAKYLPVASLTDDKCRR